jgi:uncharacterized protein
MNKESSLLPEQEKILANTESFVKEKLANKAKGHHDWQHIERVKNLAVNIAIQEGANVFTVTLGALLHDIADWKFQENKDTETGMLIAKKWLDSQNVDSKIIEEVCDIVANSSFKGAEVEDNLRSLEGQVVQDADRLDAMGAIGIGRTFAYGGANNREMYNPDIEIKMAKSFEDYKNAGQTTINHFYEKLLLLKDRMNTNTGKMIAEHRHKYMEEFLQEFMQECRGNK